MSTTNKCSTIRRESQCSPRAVHSFDMFSADIWLFPSHRRPTRGLPEAALQTTNWLSALPMYTAANNDSKNKNKTTTRIRKRPSACHTVPSLNSAARWLLQGVPGRSRAFQGVPGRPGGGPGGGEDGHGRGGVVLQFTTVRPAEWCRAR